MTYLLKSLSPGYSRLAHVGLLFPSQYFLFGLDEPHVKWIQLIRFLLLRFDGDFLGETRPVFLRLCHDGNECEVSARNQ